MTTEIFSQRKWAVYVFIISYTLALSFSIICIVHGDWWRFRVDGETLRKHGILNLARTDVKFTVIAYKGLFRSCGEGSYTVLGGALTITTYPKSCGPLDFSFQTNESKSAKREFSTMRTCAILALVFALLVLPLVPFLLVAVPKSSMARVAPALVVFTLTGCTSMALVTVTLFGNFASDIFGEFRDKSDDQKSSEGHAAFRFDVPREIIRQMRSDGVSFEWNEKHEFSSGPDFVFVLACVTIALYMAAALAAWVTRRTVKYDASRVILTTSTSRNTSRIP